MLPGSHGNPGPRYRVAIALPAGPRRVVEDGERPRHHIATVARDRRDEVRRSPPDLRRCRNILVVNLDFIGDWVLKTPFLQNLRHNAPRARITAVVLDRAYALASTCRSVDRVISLSRADQRRAVFGAAGVSAMAAFRRDFIQGRFDLAVVPRWDADFNGALQIAHGSRAAHVVGFSERSMSRRRQLNRGDDRYYTHAVVDRRIVHEGERDLVLIEAMGGRIIQASTRVDFGARETGAAKRFLNNAFGRPDGQFLAVAPFGSEARRTLPAETLARVVDRLADRFDLAVVVAAGPREADAAAAFAARLGGRAASAAGVLTMSESAALFARAAAFVGMDSGPAHVAAAVGAPVAVLICHPTTGSPNHTAAPERFAPLGAPRQVLVIRPDSAAPPCKDGCVADEAHCIRGLTQALLWPKLRDFVGAASNRRAQRSDRAALVGVDDGRQIFQGSVQQ